MNSNTKLTYHKLQPITTPRFATKATNEQRFWKKYAIESLLISKSAVTSVCSNSNEKELMLFGHGRSVTIVDSIKKQVVKSLDNFEFPITALSIRADGQIMALGDEVGKIEVKDTKEKFNLRTFKNHQKRINCLDYSGQDLYSAGEDMIIRLYDVAAGAVIHSYDHAHDDYIKCIKGLENNHLLTGGYDGKVKLFDFRVHEAAQLEFNHNAQVEWFDLFPSHMNFVVCGEKKLTSWDIRSSTPIFQNISSKKLISCVRVASKGSRIISSSYDNYFKVYKSDTFEVTYQQKMESPILSFDLNKSNQCIGLGLQNKKILLKARSNATKDTETDDEDREVEEQIGLWLKNNETKNKFAYNDNFFYRGIYDKSVSFDIKFERNQNKKVSEYDRFLKKFQYKKAFFTALRKKNMTIFIALVDEYIQRGCLQRMLKSLVVAELEELLESLGVFLHDVRYSGTSIMLLEHLADIYGKQRTVAWSGIRQQIDEEIGLIESMAEVQGMIDLINKNASR